MRGQGILRGQGIKKYLNMGIRISDLNDEEIVRTFCEKELQNTSQIESRVEKVIKRKGDRLYVKWEGCDNLFNSWINMKDRIRMGQCSPELYKHSGGSIKVELDLSNYGMKTNRKKERGINTYTLASKTGLASLKTKVDNFDADKLKTVRADLSKIFWLSKSMLLILHTKY